MRPRSSVFAAVVLAFASTASVDGARANPAPAARIGDIGVAPQSPPSPILPPGAATVLVCGKPAARLGDAVVFTATTPTVIALQATIAAGSPTVFIAGKPAARVGDTITVGGTIMGPGCPTVIIGP